jgi:hypothetical protein
MDYKNIDEINNDEKIKNFKEIFNYNNIYIYRVEFDFYINCIQFKNKLEKVNDFIGNYDIFDLKNLFSNNQFYIAFDDFDHIRGEAKNNLYFHSNEIKDMNNDYYKIFNYLKITNTNGYLKQYIKSFTIFYYRTILNIYNKCNSTDDNKPLFNID